VIGGSFNDSASADSRNAENVTFIDSPDVAGWFLTDLRQVGIGGGIAPEARVHMQDEGPDSDLVPAAVTK
jgi:hypothetical protein